MTAKEQTYAQGVVFILLAELGWSLSGVFVRLMPGLNGWQINCWRGFWMAVALLIYLVARYGGELPAKFRAIPAIALFTSAGFFAAGTTFYVTSLTMVSTATVSVIGASSPLFTGLLSPWITAEKPGPAAWTAAILALSGVGIIAWNQLDAGNPIGLAVSLMVPFSFSVQTLALRRYRQFDMIPAICLGGFLAFFAAGFLGFFAKPGGGFAIAPREMLLLAVMGPLQLSAPLVFYAQGAKSVAAITLALIVMLDAVLNPFWPWAFLGEMPDRAAFIGGAIIIGAVAISIFGSRWMTRARN